MFLKLFDFTSRHKFLSVALLASLLVLCLLSVLRLRFDEDITAFLPIDARHKEALQIYQEVASADKIVVQLSGDTPERLIEAAQHYENLIGSDPVTSRDLPEGIPMVDAGQIEEVVSFIYSHLPYLLEADDYARLDSLWTDDTYPQQCFERIQRQLGSMAGSFLMPALQHDPLNLGHRIGARLQAFQPQMNYLLLDGYLFTPDSSACILSLKSPYGSSETAHNGELVDALTALGQQLQQEAAFSQVQCRLMGAPVVAVGNARQIQHDTLIAVVVSLTLILLLLLWAFRSLRALLNIVLATGFGFLFGLAGISLFHAQISLIVIGISSVITGIAVNYPLHMSCEGGGRQALSRLVKPLLIGNITTVGAFLTLVPLQAEALRDLGLFSALMLIGTILWVLVVQPHLGRSETPLSPQAHLLALPEVGASLSRRWRTALVGSLALITLVLGYFSLDTSFDSDLSNLNYMTAEQRSDMARLQQMQGDVPGVEVYLTGTPQELEALNNQISRLPDFQKSNNPTSGFPDFQISTLRNPLWFLPSPQAQQEHLTLWRDFWSRHDYLTFLTESRRAGFSDEAFEPFRLLVEEEHPLLAYEDFAPLTETILTGYVNPDHYVVRITVPDAAAAERVEAALPGAFDLASLNRKVVNTLTSDFNYIGFACGCIVFVFLWLSFRRIELAFVAFLPMAIGWLWILGLMQLFGIQFNIVNIILATFIFGQGDDYTIFITESIIRRYREGRTDNRSEMESILLSAAIMLLGIGVLILAKHPAMHSLAQVTIIGMAVVVLMAWLVPPLVFHWLVRHDASLRRYLEKE